MRHNRGVLRLPTAVLGLTWAVACGSGPAAPKPLSRELPASATMSAAMSATMSPAAPVPVDAAAPDAGPAPVALACPDGTAAAFAPAPEPTRLCVRPDGTRHGPFVTAFPDGSPEVTGSYQDGRLDGPWQRRAPGGAIVETGAYQAGQKHGTWTQASPSGAVLGRYDLRAGTGVERRWLDDGSLYSERGLRAGAPHGAERVLGPDGAPVITAQWTLGKLDGPHVVGTRASLRIEETFAGGVRRGARQIWQFWSPIVDEVFDRAGRRNGDYTIWRSKKTPRVKGEFDHGRRDGLWTWTDRDGNKERQGNYVNGRKDGPWTEWYENKIVFTGSYSRGRPDGEFIYYDRNENELGRFTIRGGTGTLLTFWPNRKIATRQHVYQGSPDGLYQELTPRGKVVVDGHYRGELKHGAWVERTADGAPLLEQTWKRGKLDGTVRKYVDGQLASEATYQDGKAQGAYAEYRAGKPAVTGQFADDRRTGTWTERDAEGRVVLTSTYRDGVLDGPWRQLVDGAVVEGAMRQGRRAGTWTRTDAAGAVQRTTYPGP